jgi:hypothetical protein
MRTRAATLVALILVSAAVLVGGGSAARADDRHAPTDTVLLAQETGEDPGEANVGEEEEAQQTGGEEEDGGGAAEESGAGEGETGGAADETGPPWTYQMARIALALTVLLGIGIALMYRKLIGTRQRV